MVNYSSAYGVIINHCWFFRQAMFKNWFVIEIWMVMDEFPFHLLRIHFTVPFWVCSLTSRSTCHGITFINFSLLQPTNLFSCLSLVKCFVALLSIKPGNSQDDLSFHSNIPVGLFAQSKLRLNFHIMVQMYRRLCFHMLASFHWSVLTRQVVLRWSVNKMNFPIRFTRWLSLTGAA